MPTSKDEYLKWSLLIIIVVLGSVLVYQFLPYLSGLLGAFTIYLIVRKQMIYFTEKKRFNKTLSVIIILFEVLLCILLPTYAVLDVLVGRVSSFDLHPESLIPSLHNFMNGIDHKIGYNFLSTDNISDAAGYISDLIKLLIGEISSFVINSLVLLLILYFMLLGGRKMEQYIMDILPFREKNKKRIIKEIDVLVRSNAIGIPLLAIIQGIVGGIGYSIFQAPDPMLFALLTCFASVIPLVGTALVWCPLCIYLFAIGDTAHAIGLTIYSVAVISNVDSVARFILQKKMADTHPLITIFGVIIGLNLFGFWGVIFGPLLIALFLLCFDLFKQDYIDSKTHK